jgi:secreted PhoX family phosphatase
MVNALTARADANTRGATGYYRPEDLHDDPTYVGPGVSFCWTNTGNGDASFFAEVLCATDTTPAAPSTRTTKVGGAALAFPYQSQGGGSNPFAVATVNRFIEGDPRFNSHDNLAFQPISGRVYVIEDDTHGEIWACLKDGLDRDIKSDGCVAMLSVRDPAAEPTGFVFDGTGQVAFYNVQHGGQPAGLLDFTSNPVNGQTDDLIKITGFGAPASLQP